MHADVEMNVCGTNVALRLNRKALLSVRKKLKLPSIEATISAIGRLSPGQLLSVLHIFAVEAGGGENASKLSSHQVNLGDALAAMSGLFKNISEKGYLYE